jgi:hypothetical protein
MKDKKHINIGIIGNLKAFAVSQALFANPKLPIIERHLEFQQERDRQVNELRKIYDCANVAISNTTLIKELNDYGFDECKKRAINVCGLYHQIKRCNYSDLIQKTTTEKKDWKSRIKDYLKSQNKDYDN